MRDYVGIVRQLESYYAKAKGSATLGLVAQNQDEELRQSLVPFANNAMRAIEKMQRWRRGFTSTTVPTVSGTSLYSFSGGSWTYIHRVYWRYTTGRIVDLDLMDQNEPRLIYGDGPGAPPGAPRYYALVGAQGDQIQLYPTPDNAGPDAGVYTLQIEYYRELPQIIETVSSPTLSVALVPFTTAGSGRYLTASGAISANPNLDTLTIRQAGNPTGISGIGANDDYTDTWTAITANDFTLTNSTTVTAAGQQTFFYSSNWLIDIWPKVLLFAVAREIAAYLKSKDIAMWDARYEKELQDLMEWDTQSRHDVEVLAGAVSGQRQPLLRDETWPQIYDTRGIVR